MNIKRRSLFTFACIAASIFALSPVWSQAQSNTKTLRMVPHANLTILDPIWTTAYVTRNHAYMIYDTLFATDSKGDVKPQMVDKWTTSKDGKTWSFTLRDGLEFHDGKPVTSEDVVASLKRWASRDTMGGLLAKFISKYEVLDAKTFRLVLNEPCGIILDALGKSSSNVPFIMPARVAATPGTEQIKENIGSGPFVMKMDEYKPGEKVVYVKNAKYRPRAEAPDGMAGAHVVKVDRVEWRIIRDPQTQFNALKAGEVDMIEQASFEQVASLKATEGIALTDMTPAGLQFIFRFNHLSPPFDNVKIRQAAMVAMGQLDYLKTQVGVPGLYRFCKSIFPCGTTYSSENTSFFTGVADPKRAAKMLKDAGYNGTPVVLMRPTDLGSIAKLPLVAKQQLEAAGFKVDMPQMDWTSLVARRAKKDAPDKGGWNAFMTAWAANDIANPLTMAMLNAQGDKGWFGWQNEPRFEDLKAKFARSASLPERKKLAEQMQLISIDTASHVVLGQYNVVTAIRKNVSGLLENVASVPLMWNVAKN